MCVCVCVCVCVPILKSSTLCMYISVSTGPLLAHIQRLEHFTEQEANLVVVDITSALYFLHSKGYLISHLITVWSSDCELHSELTHSLPVVRGSLQDFIWFRDVM